MFVTKPIECQMNRNVLIFSSRIIISYRFRLLKYCNSLLWTQKKNKKPWIFRWTMSTRLKYEISTDELCSCVLCVCDSRRQCFSFHFEVICMVTIWQNTNSYYKIYLPDCVWCEFVARKISSILFLWWDSFLIHIHWHIVNVYLSIQVISGKKIINRKCCVRLYRDQYRHRCRRTNACLR